MYKSNETNKEKDENEDKKTANLIRENSIKQNHIF